MSGEDPKSELKLAETDDRGRGGRRRRKEEEVKV